MDNLSADFFKRTQKITAEACGISERSIQNIVAEVKKCENNDTPTARSLFVSPRKSYKRKKEVTDIDDFNVDVVRRTVHEFYDKGNWLNSKYFFIIRKHIISYIPRIKFITHI